MSFKNILLVHFFLLSFGLFSQQNSIRWIAVEGIIKDIEFKRGGKRMREFALVNYTTTEGKSFEVQVELVRFPFLGSFKSIGDEITVNYDENNPAIARTITGKFIEQYGMYILIALGIGFSIQRMIKIRKSI